MVDEPAVPHLETDSKRHCSGVGNDLAGWFENLPNNKTFSVHVNGQYSKYVFKVLCRTL